MDQEPVKYFIMVFGNTMNSQHTFMDHLMPQLNLCEVSNEGDSDVIIAFVASNTENDIRSAWQGIPATRPVVLVVLHHTSDPHVVIPDSSNFVHMSNVFTVDCLFHEDRGLLQCLRNEEARKATAEHLKGLKKTPSLPIVQMCCIALFCLLVFLISIFIPPHSDKYISAVSPVLLVIAIALHFGNCVPSFQSRIRYSIKTGGNTMNSHLIFMEDLTSQLNLCEESTMNTSDVIIYFVPIVSRAGTDIEAALHNIPANQPVVLVVLHHTLDPYSYIQDSRHAVDMSNVFTVDCVFNEDQGLLRCARNDEAVKATVQHLSAIKMKPGFPVLRIPLLSCNISSLQDLSYLAVILAYVFQVFTIASRLHNLSVWVIYVTILILPIPAAIILLKRGHKKLVFCCLVLIMLILFIIWLSVFAIVSLESNSTHKVNHPSSVRKNYNKLALMI